MDTGGDMPEADRIADCVSSLMSFTEYMFDARHGTKFVRNKHQDIICEKLEQVVIGKIKRLIINVPPRSGKTEIAVLNFIAWSTGLFPQSEWIHASYSKRLAANNAYNVREIMRHEAYQSLFPWVKIRADSNAKDEFRTEQGGVIYATGSDGSITGRGAGGINAGFKGAIIIDDALKPNDASSETMRQNVLDWFSTTIESRKNSPDTPIIIIMQRLHEMDLTGWLLSGGNGEQWEHLVIPARNSDGSSFWPAQFPEEMLARLEASSPYVFAGQYMQAPAPVGGGIFKDAWWQYLSAPPPISWRAIYADTAQKTKEQNDFSVMQCWGRTVGGQAVLLDMVQGKWEAPELETMARAFWAKHKATDNQGTLRAFKVEDKVSGTGLIQKLKREGIPMIGVQRDRDKVSRAFDTAPFVQSGNVIIMQNLPSLVDFLSEAALFPNAAHDDMIDCAMTAINDILAAPAAPAIRAL